MEARRSTLLLAVVMVLACAGSVEATCPTDYTEMSFGTCLRLVDITVPGMDNRKTWEEASALCRNESAELVSLDTPAKMEEFSTFVFNSGRVLAEWILVVGAKKDATGWRWRNGAKLLPDSNMWDPRYPGEDASLQYTFINPYKDHKRHYILATTAKAIFPGFVCEAPTIEDRATYQ